MAVNKLSPVIILQDIPLSFNFLITSFDTFFKGFSNNINPINFKSLSKSSSGFYISSISLHPIASNLKPYSEYSLIFYL